MSDSVRHTTDTIVALSSGKLPAGIAVVRISGPECETLEETLFVKPLPERHASLRKLYGADGSVLDEVLALRFFADRSFTGEDIIEIHAHGGRAVVAAILETVCRSSGVRLAEAGEFTRRAFENGRLDLTEVDGIADLISSETESQRRQALAQSQGALRDLYAGWRNELVHIRAMIEAEFDFADEEDVPGDVSEVGFDRLALLIRKISEHLDDSRSGEIIRDGFKVALMGEPNSGKSSLLNALAKREVAIVSEEAGTTRDVLNVRLDLNGYAVELFDTAGIRETDKAVEAEGIRRAQVTADECDLVVWLTPIGVNKRIEYVGRTPILEIISKDDEHRQQEASVSVVRDNGLDWLLDRLTGKLRNRVGPSEDLLITRQRYRDLLVNAKRHLESAIHDGSMEMEVRAEEVRRAGDCIGRITGKVDVEDLLDVIFSEFCVGK